MCQKGQVIWYCWFYFQNRNRFINIFQSALKTPAYSILRCGYFYFFKLLWMSAFPVLRRGVRLMRGLGSNREQALLAPHPCGALGLLSTTSCRPKGEGRNCKLIKAGISILPLRFHPKNPFLIPHPLLPTLEQMRMERLFPLFFYFAKAVQWVRSLKLLCCWLMFLSALY